MTEAAEIDVGVVPLHEVRHNLPTHLSSFVGRERELSEITAALGTTRVLTLTGAGGCGKSRLAARAASQVLVRFPHGAWWVELAPLTEPPMVQLALTQALGIRPGPGQSALDAAVDYLADRTALIVLDNCEHLADECARVAETLALHCPGVTVLATSREPLRIDGETPWLVPSLSLPPDGDDAVTLFAERARQLHPDFSLTPDVTDLCRKLDGIPLAIELAAARLRMLTVRQIADGLTDRFTLLAHGSRTAANRQKTLRASINWSHDLLTATERTVFRRLGVFLGGFTLEAAQQVCAIDIETTEVFDALAALLDKSLVQVDQQGSTTRYRMLETLRAYALERLDQIGETAVLRDRHRDHYLDLAERLAPDLSRTGQLDAMDLLDPEQANLTQAVEHAAATEPEKALRLCVALTFWWQMRGLLRQGDAAFRTAIEAAPAEHSALRARALYGHSLLLNFAGAVDEALAIGQQAMSMAQAVGDQRTVAQCQFGFGLLALRTDPARGRAWLTKARDLATEVGSSNTVAFCTQALATAYLHHGDTRNAAPLIDEGMRLGERLGNRDVLAWAGTARAFHAALSGDHALCRAAAARAIAEARLVGDVACETGASGSLARAYIDAGEPQAAISLLVDVLARARALGAGMISVSQEAILVWAEAADGRLDDAKHRAEELIEHGALGYLMARMVAHSGLAEVLRLRGDDDRAETVGRGGLTLVEQNDDHWLGAMLRLTLGRLAATRGEWLQAQRLHHEALADIVDNGYRPLLPRALEALAETTTALGHPIDAARIIGAARHVRDELGLVAWEHQRAEVDDFHDRLRSELGDEAFERALAAGRALSIDDAIAFVRRTRGARGRPSFGWDSLTPTERDVARHAAKGLTNPQIAERMFITRETVKGHLAKIYPKLGITNRTELANEVTRHAEQERGSGIEGSPTR